MNDFVQGRERLLRWLRTQLMGPAFVGDEISGSPLNHYPTGILFPVTHGEEALDQEASDEEDADPLGENEHVPVAPVAKHPRYVVPSSIGFSFFIRGTVVQLQVLCAAARYELLTKLGSHYKRSKIGTSACAYTFTAPDRTQGMQQTQRVAALEDRAGLEVLWRPHAEGWIVTVSLFNQQEWHFSSATRDTQPNRVEQSLFEVDLQCVIECGEVGAYPHVDKTLLQEEEQELELQYKGRNIYAVGHGAAVNWHMHGSQVRALYSEFLPMVEVPQVTTEIGEDFERVLALTYLATEQDAAEVCTALSHFIQGYADWVSGQQIQASQVDTDEREAARRMVTRMMTALQRMRRGVALLRRAPKAAVAFRLANQAMLDQMRQVDEIRGHLRVETEYRWRPFQLAFLLTVITSVIDEEDHFRGVVDLIWFPTGGGKTEAYLGLIAFLILWRRLTHAATGGGTTVLMRYTLRLLTAQQYLRATRIICALELIRRKTPALQAGEPITIGMWVGAASSPNRFSDAMKVVQRSVVDPARARYYLVLDACPWCETPFNAPTSYQATPQEFHFCCTNPACNFGQYAPGILPCNVVDEALYRAPPTLLVATIDKFARLSWEERAGVFFGQGSHRPPELVIQDELHLIAGALGSVAGLYEAALDTVLTMRGIRPKYIASTATIRMAQDQVKRLYGRELAVFPPPGLSCDDSYFARTIPTAEQPGRMYVGYLAPMLDRKHCMAPLAAALLVAPEIVFSPQTNQEHLLDAWWTQVIYNGTLKDVGSSHNAFTLDVRDIVRRLGEDHHRNSRISRKFPRIAQLTSISSVEENARTFARLEKTRDETDCLDAVLATNMISVGLDVTRLAVMILNGQPLTTAEYIQASSRVGRGAVPGLVFANFYRDQARSLSHYENFRPYHDAFYRFVEPTSVTPYTYQARTRALHAALVIAIRHVIPHLLRNTQAGQLDPTNAAVQRVVCTLKKRCLDADPERAPETHAHLDRLLAQWAAETRYCAENKRQLHYASNHNNADRLLYHHDDPLQGLWSTLQSMRNVENTALLALGE